MYWKKICRCIFHQWKSIEYLHFFFFLHSLKLQNLIDLFINHFLSKRSFVIMMEVSLNQDILINARVILRIFLIIIQKDFNRYLECLMVVHRRCRSKVGNYCGCEGNTLQLYEKWRKNVSALLIFIVEISFFLFFSIKPIWIIIINTTEIFAKFIQLWIKPTVQKNSLNRYREDINRISIHLFN